MEPIAARAASVLAQHPAPALRLSALVELLTRHDPRLRLDARALRLVLERHPQTFRFLDPWRGPWGQTRGRIPAELGAGEPWVVVVADPGGRDAVGQPGLPKLRDSVRWLAGGVDPRSCREVARAHGFVLAEREVRDALEPGARESSLRRAA